VAAELGRDLASGGVAVISGLAKGIDCSAHEGALAASGAKPVVVVETGLDTPYPGSSASAWWRVAERGLLLGESPLGSKPEAWRFPRRNRIIAAISQVVVVVECHSSSGAMTTARAGL
jgi:DNA processing protein